jgi:glucan phosphorylase
MTREYTSKLLDAIEQGLLSPQAVVEMALTYMSESEVEDMMRVNDLLYYLDAEEEEDSEYDGQPDEAQEWYDFDPDC